MAIESIEACAGATSGVGVGYPHYPTIFPQKQHPLMVYSYVRADRGGFAASRYASAWMLKALRRRFSKECEQLPMLLGEMQHQRPLPRDEEHINPHEIDIDTDGEVIFLRTSTLSNRVFKHLSNVNRAHFGLRQQDQKWARARII
jgi:hypothetical protein